MVWVFGEEVAAQLRLLSEVTYTIGYAFALIGMRVSNPAKYRAKA